MGEIRKLVAVFIGRFIFTFVIAVPVLILFLNILPYYLRYMDPMTIKDIVFYTIFTALFSAIIPPERLGLVVIDALSRFVRGLAGYVKRAISAVKR